MRTAVAEKKAAEDQRDDQCSTIEAKLWSASVEADRARSEEEAAREDLREHIAADKSDCASRTVVKEEMNTRLDFFNMILNN